MGDFNARSTFTTTVPEMEPIYARLLDAWREAPLPDADNPMGFTSSARLVGLPTARIDYVFVSEGVAADGTFVPITDATRLAADHYPGRRRHRAARRRPSASAGRLRPDRP